MMPSDTAPDPTPAARHLTIFGGTGKTGRHLVAGALAAGHHVTILARTPAKLDLQPERLRIVEGDVQDHAAVLEAVATYLECSIVLAARYGDEGVHDLRLYLHEAGVEIVPVDRDQADVALDAWMRFGKGRHPAAFDFGDCFAYALASLRDARLLFVGADFGRTDVAAA